MTDPRDDFVSSVDLSSSRVRSFSGFVFMCGGEHDLEKPPASVRSLLIREMTSGVHGALPQRLLLAEDIRDWYADAVYTDLVQLEENLASLSSLIVLVVESEGAIAELGAFSAIKRFADRMLTLVASVHYEKDTFIKLGPIKKLENLDEERVLVYDWERIEGGRIVKKFDEISDDVKDVVAKVNKIINSPSSDSVFRRDDPLHAMLLICEICSLFGALKILEIEGYLNSWGISVSSSEVKQYLFVLERCHMVFKKKRSNLNYYFSIDWSSHISFSLGGKRFDRDRLRVDVSNFYSAQDKSRFSVIKSVVSNGN